MKVADLLSRSFETGASQAAAGEPIDVEIGEAAEAFANIHTPTAWVVGFLSSLVMTIWLLGIVISTAATGGINVFLLGALLLVLSPVIAAVAIATGTAVGYAAGWCAHKIGGWFSSSPDAAAQAA